MKLNELHAVFATYITFTAFQDGSVNLSFGVSQDGTDANCNYSTAVHVPFKVLQNLRQVIDQVIESAAAGGVIQAETKQ